MKSPTPRIGKRRASGLHAELDRAARASLPGWRGEPGDFTDALMRIGARLAEHVTMRCERVPERDRIAFFDALDIPPVRRRAARTPLVMQLVEGQSQPVLVPAGTQAVAETEDGETKIFESEHALLATPARLAAVLALDTATDRIERAPVGFETTVEPELTPRRYASSFASAGSASLQLEPIDGLEPGTLLRIAGVVHRVRSVDGDICTLDPVLAANVEPGDEAEVLHRHDVGEMLDEQSHDVYIGHPELLALEGEATINVIFTPATVSGSLSDVEWTLYAVRGEEEAGWVPLGAAEAEPGVIRLNKDWLGKAVETETPNGIKGLWIRAHQPGPILDAAMPGTRVAAIEIAVESVIGAESSTAGEADDSSASINHAFHNAEPLPLTSRFKPFGSAPLLGDTFTLGAAETLSKKGAIATFDFKLQDSTVRAMSVAQSTTGIRIYAVGERGSLQLLTPRQDAEMVWREIGRPGLADITERKEKNADTRPPVFGADASPQVIESSTGADAADIVVARDTFGRFWAARVDVTDTEALEARWAQLSTPDPKKVARDIVLLCPVDGQPGALARAVIVFDGGLRFATIDVTGRDITVGPWKEFDAQSGQSSGPTLGPTTRLVTARRKGWPTPSNESEVRLVTVSDQGASGEIWTVTVSGSTAKDWSQIDPIDPGVSASTEVRPAAVVLESDDVVVFASTGPPENLRVFDATAPQSSSGQDFAASPGSTIEALPNAMQDEPRAVAFGLSDGQPAYTIFGGNAFAAKPLPPRLSVPVFNERPPAGAIAPLGDAPTLLLAGAAETFHQNRLAAPISASFLTALRLPTSSPVGIPFYVKPKHADRTVERISTGPIFLNDDVSEPEIYPSETMSFDAGARVLIEDESFDDGELLAANKLKRSSSDSSTDASDHVVVEGKVFKVESLAGAELTLDSDVASGGQGFPRVASYARVSDSGVTLTVLDTDVGVLMRVSDNDPRPLVSQRVRVVATDGGASTDPATQQVVKAHNSYALLGAAWTTPPSAAVAVELLGVDGDRWTTAVYDRGHQRPSLSWEYHDGTSWRRIEGVRDSTENFARSGKVEFVVPADIDEGEVAGQDNYWVRARLIGGDYGRAVHRIKTEPAPDEDDTEITSVTIDTSGLLPPEVLRVKAQFSAARSEPSSVIVRNNLTPRDQSQAARSTEAEIDLFEGAARVSGEAGLHRELYLGLSARFELPISLYVDAKDGDRAFELEAHTRDRDGAWRALTCEDETDGLQRAGFLTLKGSAVPARATILGEDSLCWIRLRPTGDSAVWKPRVAGVYLNAVTATEAETLKQEVLGSGTGAAGQSYQLGRRPVLLDPLEIRVREKLGAEELEALETDLTPSGAPRVSRYEDISLDGDWVLWDRVESFVGRGAEDRVFRLDATTGVIRFGDRTKPPPVGRDNIRAVSYRVGGGADGNVAAYSVSGLRSAIQALESVVNPVAAWGGADAPDDPADHVHGAADLVRHRGHALTARDIEAIIVASAPERRRARCLPPESAGQPIRIAALVEDGTRIPSLARAERESIETLVRANAATALTPDGIRVEPPNFVRMRLSVRLVANDPEQAGALLAEARERLIRFFAPVHGGPDARGWAFGRRPHESDVLVALAGAEGLDTVSELDLSPIDHGIDLDRLDPFAIICAQLNHIRVVVATNTEAQR